MSESALVERATRAYYRGDPEHRRPYPANTSGVKWGDDGNATVVLRNVNGVPARYSWSADADRLRRLSDEGRKQRA